MIWNGTGAALMCCFVLSSLGLLSILRSQRCFFLTSSHTRNRTKTHKITFTRLHTHIHTLYLRHAYTRTHASFLPHSQPHALTRTNILYISFMHTLIHCFSLSIHFFALLFCHLSSYQSSFYSIFFQIGSWSNSERQLDNIYQMEPVVRTKQFMPHRL